MKKLAKWESEHAWSFAYAVKRFVKTERPDGYIFPATIAQSFGVPKIQVELALRLMCQIAEMGRRDDGRYFVVSDPERQRRQNALLQLERA